MFTSFGMSNSVRDESVILAGSKSDRNVAVTWAERPSGSGSSDW